jgi:hypothetical protein
LITFQILSQSFLACGGKWKGIIVQGNSDESQDFNEVSQRREQGYVEMKNGVIIENADFGVRLYDPEEVANESHGGVIIATNSTIRNCVTGVDFALYENFDYIDLSPKGNASSFRNCAFITNDDMINEPVIFRNHVSMRGITGLRFYACRFMNLQQSNLDIELEKRGQGIRALDSEFKVLGVCTAPFPSPLPCTSYQHSIFRGLANGILAGNKGGINTFNVDRADFASNHFGIAGYASDNCSITRSRFSVGSPLETQTNP